MTKSEALDFIRDHSDDDPMDTDELESVFAALYGRTPDRKDQEDGLWSMVCAYAQGGKQ